jgi:Putative motility protein
MKRDQINREVNFMNAIQLQQAVNFSLTKQVQETAQVQASMMLEGFAKTQQNIQAAQASHPVLGKSLDIKA